MNGTGHFETVAALVARTLRPVPPPASTAWTTTVDDLEIGPRVSSGRLASAGDTRDLVILIHGLGGSSESGYMASAAGAAAALGMSSLRLNLRGADGRSRDFYHGGLTEDLHTVIANLQTPNVARIFLLGFSLGGHVALRYATEVEDPRVAAIAAVCSPLDLAAGAKAIDQPRMAPYRGYILRRLLANYRKSARLGKVPTPPHDLRRVRTIRDWDSLTVVPRFGFDSADDYYSRASVGPLLDRLKRPALLLAAENDPMIPPAAIRPSLEAARGAKAVARLLSVRWLERGGHLGFSKRLDLGLEGPTGMEYQVLLWLARTADAASR